MAGKFTEDQQKQIVSSERQNRSQSPTGQNRGTSLEQAQTVASEAKSIYEKLQVSGQWFLWKLYLSELFESIQQCSNLVTVYLCSLPIEITSPVCLLLAIDCIHSVFIVISDNTPARRHNRLVLDALMDFLCVALPLGTLYFGYNVPISIPEMIAVTISPSFFLLAKLDDIFEELIRRHAANVVLNEQRKYSFRQKRRKKSLFKQISYLEVADKQQKSVPWRVRVMVAICKGLFAFFFFVLAFLHLGLQPTGCDKKLWLNGCVNKIPFCKSLFKPRCNCVSIHVENDNTLTSLPEKIVDDMNGLRKVFIRKSNLTTLPQKMELFTEMVYFEISYSYLQNFNVDISKWKKLWKLHLMHNNIDTYNEIALWNHPNLNQLAVFGNVGMKLPTHTSLSLPRLRYLHFGENNATVDVSSFKSHFPSLVMLFLNKNKLSHFSDASMKNTLAYLGVARCSLKSLPSYLLQFKNLKYLDARDNDISFINDDLKNMLKKNSVESYFSGNPVCKTDRSLDCEPLCDEICWSRNVANDGICDDTCTSKKCMNDGGDCM
eukprot:g1683.t1